MYPQSIDVKTVFYRLFDLCTVLFFRASIFVKEFKADVIPFFDGYELALEERYRWTLLAIDSLNEDLVQTEN